MLELRERGLPTITRRQELRRQIDAAIWLWAVRDEPLVANLIAYAALDVLRSLCGIAKEQTFKGKIEENIKSDMIKLWREYDRRAYTHSKHADKDPLVDLEDFHPEIAEFNILAAITDFSSLYKTNSPTMLLFRTVALMRRPEVLKDGEFKDVHLAQAEFVRGYLGEGKDLRQHLRDLLLLVEANPALIAAWPQEHLEPV